MTTFEINSTQTTFNSSIKTTQLMDLKTNESSIESNLKTNSSHELSNIENSDQLSVNVSSFGSHYYYLTFGAIIAIILIIVLIVIIIRKKRLDKLRHHLMPVYKFDPNEESCDDWETELLDGLTSSLTKGSTVNKSRQLYTNERERPQLSFARV
jgi:hypothetical protein